MKKVIIFGAMGTLLLGSCSLLQRHDETEDPTRESENIEGAAGEAAPSVESEVSRMNTKISALETKLDVLTSNMERLDMQRQQPVIEAQASPQPTMAAPVEVPESTQVSAAPIQPAALLPTDVKSASSAAADSAPEKEFRSAMVLFQNGKNMEAASHFALLAKKYPQHLLASHSLYWAGEASARGQQWSLATENWEELEKRYPRSAYVPEALAGLAHAYESQGDAAKASTYKNILLRSFPKSPVALSFHSSSSQAEAPRARKANALKAEVSEDAEPATPAYQEESSETGGE
ncbi:MAG: tetratricopeptide repeat protein [Bdellovibrionota bacterium]